MRRWRSEHEVASGEVAMDDAGGVEVADGEADAAHEVLELLGACLIVGGGGHRRGGIRMGVGSAWGEEGVEAFADGPAGDPFEGEPSCCKEISSSVIFVGFVSVLSSLPRTVPIRG